MSALAKVLSLSQARAAKAVREVLKREADKEAKLGGNLPTFPIPYRKGQTGVMAVENNPGDAFFTSFLAKTGVPGSMKSRATGFVKDSGFKPDWFDWAFKAKNQKANDEALKRGLEAISKRPSVFFDDGSVL